MASSVYVSTTISPHSPVLLVWIANTSIREISRANYQYLVWNTTASMMNDSSGMRDGRRSQSEINNTDCPSAQTLFNTIIRAARDALQETHLTYDNVHAFDASIVVSSLQENPLFESVCPRLSYNAVTIKTMPT
ncbi:hypothetical protein I7I53_10734 [Histoplasma capsulatum var. duboisii H88]|uniref:Uncharacterized protein n=1 Tax=Ajellomyces capsulatus (strain H88) TaxID=544711 RepID=A0A8A1L976_AJEC8|nr:hypothetical protein I7I53_10734 [Histoplasma capsulatum var. duboisii H88]